MGTGAAHQLDRVGVLDAQGAADRRARAGRGRLHHRRASRRSPTRGSATRSPTTASPPTAPLPGFRPSASRWCSAACTRPMPPSTSNLRDSLGKLRLNDASFEYEPESSSAPGPGLPLRLPGPAAPRDHPGAARARVRPRPRHHRTLGGLPRAPDRRRGRWSCTTPPTIPTRPGSTTSRSPGSRPRSWCPTSSWAASCSSAPRSAACSRS